MNIITNPKFFENTENATIRKSYKNTTNPHKDQDQQIESKLLLVIQWDSLTQFVYEKFTLLTKQTEIVNIREESHRSQKSNEKIIHDHIQYYYKTGSGSPREHSDLKILACNTNEYPVKKLISQLL